MPQRNAAGRIAAGAALACLLAVTNRATADDGAAAATAGDRPAIEQYLHAGRLEAGEKAVRERLELEPNNDGLRFQLGAVQLCRAAEGLARAWYDHGFQNPAGGPMGAGIPMPASDNPDPQELSYDKARAIIEEFADGLAGAEATLAEIDMVDVKMPLRVGRIRFDVDGDGQADGRLGEAIVGAFGGAMKPDDPRLDVDIAFDFADTLWLRAYCRMLRSVCDAALAYDHRELFERTAHIWFPKVDSPHAFLEERDRPPFRGGFFSANVEIEDLIAFIHLLNFPLEDAERLKRAHAHLVEMNEISREMWDRVIREVDDDREWIPNPDQTGALGGKVSQEQINEWLKVVEEFDALLAGEKVVPFWRGQEPRGVNIRRVFHEPRRFDLVMWVQGTGATPFLTAPNEKPLTDRSTWRTFGRMFGGQFFGFALGI
jgi:hypothetical protein